MYPVSADFHNLSIADAPTSRVRIYFIEANVDCTDDNDVQSNGTLLCMPGETDSNGRIEKGGVTINEFFNSDANVQIGATVSSQIGMTLINRDGALDGFNYGRCKVYIDVYDDTNSTWLTCPMGVYNIAIPKRRKVQLVSATGYDQMQQLDAIADSWWNGLDWSNGITLLQIIQSMVATLGIHLSANTSANIVNSGLSYTEIPFTAIEMTYRDILSYIAETTGTIARFDRNGALDLRWFSDAALSTDTQTYAGGLVTFTATDRASISSLSVPFSPIQDLHGYANPWPGGGGKNKIDQSKTYQQGANQLILGQEAAYSTRSIFLTAGTYTISVALSGGKTAAIYLATDSNTGGSSIGNTRAARSFTLESDSHVAIWLYAGNGITASDLVSVQLESGSSATAWTPYSNICPISGRTGLSVYDDPKYGGTIEWNQIVSQNTFSVAHSENGGTVEWKDANTVKISGLINSVSWLYVARPSSIPANNHIYIATTDSKPNIEGLRFGIINNYGTMGYKNDTDLFYLFKNTSGIKAVNYRVPASVTVDFTAHLCLFDLTQMFGSTKADEILTMEQSEAGSGVAYFKSLFPNEYYAYNSGTMTCVSAVNGDPYWKKDIDWTTQAGTVYGGTLDVVTGVLTVDRASVLFDGTQLVGLANWNPNSSSVGWLYAPYVTPGLLNVEIKSSNLQSCGLLSDTLETVVYGGSSGVYGATKPCISLVGSSLWGVAMRVNDTTLTTNARINAYLSANPIRVVYKLATPLTYQLTAQEIEALVGTNNVWSTGDSVSVTVSEPNLVEIQTDTVGNQCLSIDVGEYQVSQIDALSVKVSQADVGVTIGTGGNAYTILDNPMLFGDEAAITTKATPIYNRLSAFRLFTPISMRCIMDWSIEAGDIITVTNESVTYDLPIFQQRLRWRGGYVVSDLFSNGEQERPTQSKEIRSSFRSNTQMHEFEVTLEQLRSYIQSVDGNYTLIQQTVDAITQTVANQNVTIQNILDPTGEIWTAITKNTSNLSSIEDSLNNEITERRSYIRFIPSEPAIVMGVDEDNEIKLKLVNNIIYFFNGADDSTDLSLAYAYFNSQEAFADRFVAGESVQIGTNDNAAHWLWKKLNNGDLVLELVG